ncbi:hypothetical protein SLEP1_g18534 [Rubroshorea leprosula]|uniref:Exostosin GT47 domain-containing protein n=1 Tax=Rubroshorea leprosula TaxID=152421 RepID=A0AAV5J3Q7_9ROSI|nr:hypothetical protein SLEP1_g18534 [Rubroshorea leprosula]
MEHCITAFCNADVSLPKTYIRSGLQEILLEIFGQKPPSRGQILAFYARSYAVNSQQADEAIFYECVPVNLRQFCTPFFEGLDWEAFSIILAEKDIPNLKDILLSIPEDKYLVMQLAVRKVQRHF